MTAKLIFTCACSFIGSSVLFAQSAAVSHTEQLTDPEAFNAVRLLEQNALLALIGAVALICLVWTCSILKACVALNKPQKSPRRISVMLLVLIAGLSVFCGSCSAGRWEQAEQYRKAMGSEYRNRPCLHEYAHPTNMPFNNRYTSNGYSNWVGPAVCKYCGQVDFSRYH